MAPLILQIYQRINSLLIAYQEDSIDNKFVKKWNQFKKLCRTSCKRRKEKIYFDSKLDKLFDIINC